MSAYKLHFHWLKRKTDTVNQAIIRGSKTKPEFIMKLCVKNLFLVPALIAGLGLLSAGRAPAQTYTGLHSFRMASGPDSTNSVGADPQAGLFLSGSTLYGTANQGAQAS